MGRRRSCLWAYHVSSIYSSILLKKNDRFYVKNRFFFRKIDFQKPGQNPEKRYEPGGTEKKQEKTKKNRPKSLQFFNRRLFAILARFSAELTRKSSSWPNSDSVESFFMLFFIEILIIINFFRNLKVDNF